MAGQRCPVLLLFHVLRSHACAECFNHAPWVVADYSFRAQAAKEEAERAAKEMKAVAGVRQ